MGSNERGLLHIESLLRVHCMSFVAISDAEAGAVYRMDRCKASRERSIDAVATNQIHAKTLSLNA